MARINPPPELCDPSEAEHVCELLAQHHARVVGLADAGDHAGVALELQHGRPALHLLADGVLRFADQLGADDARLPASERLLAATRADDAELLRSAWLAWIAACGAAHLYHDAPKQSRLQAQRRSGTGISVDDIRGEIARQCRRSGATPKKLVVAMQLGVDERTLSRVLKAAGTCWREITKTTTGHNRGSS